ncbi:uncharacterized protein METZ01_LOCUS446309, partial [marine metagenome]
VLQIDEPGSVLIRIFAEESMFRNSLIITAAHESFTGPFIPSD